MNFKLDRVYPGIYHLQFDNTYDTAMHFLRYQENYESPKWHGVNDFSLVEYMDWYAKDQCSGWEHPSKEGEGRLMFSYPGDWTGFNIPSYVFDRCNEDTIPDWNSYDEFMSNLIELIRCSENGGKFYLIGTTFTRPDDGTLAHEISHGLFYTREDYTTEATALYESLDPKVAEKLKDWLLSSGYTEAVVVDETVAYLATGLEEPLDKDAACKKARGKFQTLLKKYME